MTTTARPHKAIPVEECTSMEHPRRPDLCFEHTPTAILLGEPWPFEWTEIKAVVCVEAPATESEFPISAHLCDDCYQEQLGAE